ncbi:hypothetical protein [Streptomyces sp. 147326]|uniref:hypothetical protein n=1 Tax=Streptomyces sp. 147326 TaxID=3074379 RepID=UPI003857F3F7
MNFEHIPELGWSYGYPTPSASWLWRQAARTAPSAATAGSRAPDPGAVSGAGKSVSDRSTGMSGAELDSRWV